MAFAGDNYLTINYSQYFPYLINVVFKTKSLCIQLKLVLALHKLLLVLNEVLHTTEGIVGVMILMK